MVLIKVCGLKQVEHAIIAAEAGADYLGFVFARSPRQVTPEQASAIIGQLPRSVIKIGVFVDERADVVNEIVSLAGLDMVQLHGNETPDYCDRIRCPVIKAFRVKDDHFLEEMESFRNKADLFLLDTYVSGKNGGTGKTFDWALAKQASGVAKIMLAGGLNSKNVGLAVKCANPFGVDVSGGVETAGVKDPEKIIKFIEQARGSQDVYNAG